MSTQQRTAGGGPAAPQITLTPILARLVSGRQGLQTPVREPLLRIVKVQGISMTAGPRENPEDENEPEEGETLYAYRIFLSDDVYVVGAVVDPALHQLVHDRILMTGTYVRLTDYDVKTAVKKFATKRYTRYLKVRDLIIEHSPSIQFVKGDQIDHDGDTVIHDDDDDESQIRDVAEYAFDDDEYQDDEQVVVIKQETAATSSKPLADMGLDGTRDRDENDYGLADDDDYDFCMLGSQMEEDGEQGVVGHNHARGEERASSMATTQDTFRTANERPPSPDYMLDDLDDLTPEELEMWPPSKVEPKSIVTEETIDAIWRSSQKERMPPSQAIKLRSCEGSKILKSKNIRLESPRMVNMSTDARRTKRTRPESPTMPSDPSFSPSPPKITRLSSASSPSPSPSIQSSLNARLLSGSPQSQPVRDITKLADLSKRSYGSKVDVLAIVTKVDENLITRSIGTKRDLHLLDPSVSRTVWLSVWTEPENFKPAIGTCVLFKGLTLHRFDGGSLNAYKEAGGREWYVIEPTEEMVRGVGDVKDWWRRKAVEETIKSFGAEDDDYDYDPDDI